MSSLDSVFTPRLSNIQSALDLTTERQKLLTNNLANVNVPGYKREDMDFHISLNQANGSLGTISPPQDFKSFQSQLASQQTSLRQDGNNVDLEHEISAMTETQMHYQALSLMAANYFSNLKEAIS